MSKLTKQESKEKKEFIKKCRVLAQMDNTCEYYPEDIVEFVKLFLSSYVPEYNMEEFGKIDISFVEDLGCGIHGKLKFSEGANISGRKVSISSEVASSAKIYLSKKNFDEKVEQLGFSHAVVSLFSAVAHEYRHFCQLCIARDMQLQVDIDKKYEEILKNYNLEGIKKSYDVVGLTEDEVSLLRSFYALLNKSKSEQEFSDKDVKYLIYFTRYDEIDARSFARDVIKCFARDTKIIDEEYVVPKYVMPVEPFSFSDRMVKYVGDIQDITADDIIKYAWRLENHSQFVHTSGEAEIDAEKPEFAREFGGMEAYKRYHKALSMVIYMMAESFASDKEESDFICGLIETFIENGNGQALKSLEEHKVLSQFLARIFKGYIQKLWEENKLTSSSIYTCKFFSEEEIVMWLERFLSKNQYQFASSFVMKCPAEVLPTIVEVFHKKASEIQLKFKQGNLEFEEIYELLELAKTIDIQISLDKQIDIGALLTGESSKPEHINEFNSVYEGLQNMAYKMLCKQQGVDNIEGLDKTDISAMSVYVKEMSREEFVKTYGEKELERRERLMPDMELSEF